MAKLNFLADGKTIISEGDNQDILLWELSNMGSEPRNFPKINDRLIPYSLAFSPDGEWMAVRFKFDNPIIYLWHINNTSEPYALIGHEEVVNDIVFSSDSQRLISAGDDKTIRIWDVNELEASPIILSGHQGEILDLALTANDEILVSIDANGSIRLWTWQTKNLIAFACSIANRNMTLDEWNLYVGENWSYECTCPNLSAHSTVPLERIDQNTCILSP